MAHSTSSNIIGDFTDSLHRDASALKQSHGVLGFVRGIYVIARGERRSRRAVAAMRATLAICAESCPGGGCLTTIYRQTKTIRDNYIEIVADTDRLPLPGFIKRQIQQTLADWDDLAEDCFVGGDADIRRSISEIAARL